MRQITPILNQIKSFKKSLTKLKLINSRNLILNFVNLAMILLTLLTQNLNARLVSKFLSSTTWLLLISIKTHLYIIVLIMKTSKNFTNAIAESLIALAFKTLNC